MSEPNEYHATKAAGRPVNHDAWFTSKVEKGLAAADHGELTDHQVVREMIERRYPAQALKARNIPA